MGKPQIRTQELQAIAMALYAKLGSGNAVAKRLNVSPPTAYRLLADAGVHVPNRSDKKPNRRKLDHNKTMLLVEDYRNGMSLRDIIKKHGVSQWMIRNRVKELGFSLRSVGGAKREITESMNNEIVRLGRIGVSQCAISAKLSCHQTTISKILRNNGIVSTYGARGERHGSWSGGIVEASGYLKEYIDSADPFRPMAGRSGYCPQHRIVMARYLNRMLTSNETVHHIDGNKKNNTIENLQLRIGQHGNGKCYKCSNCGSTKLEPIKL